MNKFVKLIKTYAIYIAISVCLMASLIHIIPLWQMVYSIGYILFFCKMVQHGQLRFNQKNSLYVLLMLEILLSNIFNQTFDYRFVVFYFLLLISAPFFQSYKNFIFKKKLLNVFVLFVPIIIVINVVSFLLGYNYYFINNDNVSAVLFSGITVHPMWLGALAGMSNIVIFNQFLNRTKKNKIRLKIMLVFFLLCSLFISIVSASRSALLASLISIAFISSMSLSLRKFIKLLLLIMILAVITIPFYLPYMEGIENKNSYGQGLEYGSRTELWTKRFNEIQDSPFLGVGFATEGIGENRITGRLETGSGWLAILSQLGFCGLIIVLFIIKSCLASRHLIRKNKELRLFYAILFYLCMHSCFEGYINNSGYYLCFIFWLLVGTLIDYKFYKV